MNNYKMNKHSGSHYDSARASYARAIARLSAVVTGKLCGNFGKLKPGDFVLLDGGCVTLEFPKVLSRDPDGGVALVFVQKGTGNVVAMFLGESDTGNDNDIPLPEEEEDIEKELKGVTSAKKEELLLQKKRLLEEFKEKMNNIIETIKEKMKTLIGTNTNSWESWDAYLYGFPASFRTIAVLDAIDKEYNKQREEKRKMVLAWHKRAYEYMAGPRVDDTHHPNVHPMFPPQAGRNEKTVIFNTKTCNWSEEDAADKDTKVSLPVDGTELSAITGPSETVPSPGSSQTVNVSTLDRGKHDIPVRISSDTGKVLVKKANLVLGLPPETKVKLYLTNGGTPINLHDILQEQDIVDGTELYAIMPPLLVESECGIDLPKSCLADFESEWKEILQEIQYKFCTDTTASFQTWDDTTASFFHAWDVHSDIGKQLGGEECAVLEGAVPGRFDGFAKVQQGYIKIVPTFDDGEIKYSFECKYTFKHNKKNPRCTVSPDLDYRALIKEIHDVNINHRNRGYEYVESRYGISLPQSCLKKFESEWETILQEILCKFHTDTAASFETITPNRNDTTASFFHEWDASSDVGKQWSDEFERVQQGHMKIVPTFFGKSGEIKYSFECKYKFSFGEGRVGYVYSDLTWRNLIAKIDNLSIQYDENY